MAKLNNDLMEEFPDTLPDVNTLSKKWTWKEETNSLEIVSNTGVSNAEKGATVMGKSKKMKPGGFSGMFSEFNKGKIRDNLRVQPTYGSTNRRMPSAKPSTKVKQSEDKVVTLGDVKGTSIDILSSNMEIGKPFMDILSLPQLDDFLLMLLYYFESFLELRAIENKPKPMATEPSAEERAAMALQIEKQTRAKKVLAEKYSTLLLGLGMQGQHHLACGKQRKSHSRTDRSLYEALYRFSVLVSWISFRRPEVTLIEQEVGRLFRSNTFNTNMREKEKEEIKLAIDLVKEKGDFDLGPSLPLRKQKRPAITKIVNQRSPVIVSLLPTSKESSSWLFNRDAPSCRPIEHLNWDSDENEIPLDRLFPKVSPRVGIIGDSFAGYNPSTLAPFGEESEESAALKRAASAELTERFDEKTEVKSSNAQD